MQFLELHTVSWGPIVCGTAEPCIRLSDHIFDVHVDRTHRPGNSYWFGVGTHPLPYDIPELASLILSGIAGTVTAVLRHDEVDPEFPDSLGSTVRVQLEAPMPVVAFSPDPSLALAGGLTFEEMILRARPNGLVCINWISEDAEAWYFNAVCIGGPGGTRVSKRDGTVSRVPITMAIPGHTRRG